MRRDALRVREGEGRSGRRSALRAASALLVCALLSWAGQASAQRRRSAPPPPAPPVPAAEAPSDPSLPPPPAAPAAAPAAPAPGPAASEPEPAPAAAPAAAAPAAQDAEAEQPAELAALQAELAQVMDDLVQARARVALLGKSLWKTKVRVRLDNRAEPDQVAARAVVFIDGAPIWSGDGAQLRDPERILFEGFAAPGPHVLGLEIEQRARDQDAYRYTLRESYRFVALRERRTDLRLVIDDDSDMAEDFPDDEEGSYEVQTRLEARAAALDDE